MTKNENAYIVGIIAEYNPLHKGHAWHIKKAKELAGADYCIAVMSGDFVQRGAPAIYDKYTRTAMALEAGADFSPGDAGHLRHQQRGRLRGLRDRTSGPPGRCRFRLFRK